MVHHSSDQQLPSNNFKYSNKNSWKNLEWKDHGQVEYLGPNMLECEFKAFKSPKSTVEISTTTDDNGFHQVIYPVVFLAQVFALLPVYGIQSGTTTDLKFKLFSIKCAYSLFVILSISLIVSITIMWFFESRLGFGQIGKIFV